MIEAPADELRVALYAETGRPRRNPAGRGDAHEPVYRYTLPAGAVADGALDLRWQAYDTLFPSPYPKFG
jgi:hypothetical protein